MSEIREEILFTADDDFWRSVWAPDLLMLPMTLSHLVLKKRRKELAKALI
jgi:hypothetical protein